MEASHWGTEWAGAGGAASREYRSEGPELHLDRVEKVMLKAGSLTVCP